MLRCVLSAAFCLMIGAAAWTQPAFQAVPFDQVKIDDAFWTPRLQANHDSTVPHVLDWCERTGRIRNFAKAAGLEDGDFEGLYFNDSDVYKALEGAADALALKPDPQLEARVDKIIDTIAAAQQDDGYLNTFFLLTAPEEKWTNLRDKHELYCAGHLIEAGIAYFQATKKRKLLDVAIRFADLIDSIFGPDKRHDVPGHEEIELALVKLYKLTGEQRYLDLAEFFVEQRGHTDGREAQEYYAQDHLPVREQSEVNGHAVRAMYLFSGVADIAAIKGDSVYSGAMRRIWNDLALRKMYVTGGIGVTGHGEGFSNGYDLPNDRSYSETCASIALAMYNQRLTQLYADSKFADLWERVVYNGVLAGVSLDGSLFNYRNPMSTHGANGYHPGGVNADKDHKFHRQDWYVCACCPPNVARFVPQIGGAIYGVGDDGVYINQYIGSQTNVEVNGEPIALRIGSQMPWQGAMTLTIEPEHPSEFTVSVRLPEWCDEPELKVNRRHVSSSEQNGYAKIHRTWKRGDSLEIAMPMAVRRIQAHPFVAADAGRVALQRGPVVYCLEEMDNETGVHNLALPRDAQVTAEFRPNLLGGVTVLKGLAQYRTLDGWSDQLYRSARDYGETNFVAVPYYSWDNRISGAMTVWMPEHPALAPALTIASESKVSSSHLQSDNQLSALNDQIDPKASNDASIPRFTWWDHKGVREWAQYDFAKTEILSSIEVYWFDDTGKGGCKVPESWRLYYRDGDEWNPVPFVSEYGVELNRFNRVDFGPVETDGLRIEAQLRPKSSAGILEWRVWARGNE